jgi:hypothetical protein
LIQATTAARKVKAEEKADHRRGQIIILAGGIKDVSWSSTCVERQADKTLQRCKYP